MPSPARTIPLDVTGNILERLPTKSLVRFRMISSSWRSLISDPIFRKAHFNQSFQNPKLSPRRALLSTSTRLMLLDPQRSFSRDGGALVDLRSPLAGEERRFRIVGSCNGLVCLALSDCRDLNLWNPSTGDCSKLPEPPTPTGDSYTPGFGYDSSSDDYKVVLVTYYSESEKDSQGEELWWSTYQIVAIYSLKRNSWRIFKEFNLAIHDFHRWDHEYFPESICLNGAIHWRSRTNSCGNTITAFDVSKEIFYLVPNPPYFMGFSDNALGVLGGCLCLVHGSEHEGSPSELWVMKEYGVEASWTKLTLFLNADDNGDGRSGKDSYEPLCASGDNTFIMTRNTKELIRFNDKGKILEKVCICDDSEKCEGITFVESLVSVDITSNERGEVLDGVFNRIDESAKCGRVVFRYNLDRSPLSGEMRHGVFTKYF